MTPEAQSLLTKLEAEYKKAAQYDANYRFYKLPEVATEPFYVTDDDWNSGRDSLIVIPAGAKIRLITRQEAHNLGAHGPDADKLRGLWISEFDYKYGSEIPQIKECELLK